MFLVKTLNGLSHIFHSTLYGRPYWKLRLTGQKCEHTFCSLVDVGHTASQRNMTLHVLGRIKNKFLNTLVLTY